jgi:FG-GAP repeat/FlgD Ig-like domain/FG-GAP-like repeat
MVPLIFSRAPAGPLTAAWSSALLVALLLPASATATTSGPAQLNFTLTGAAAQVGTSVAVAGDVNGDGYSDLLVGAPAYGNGELGEGEVLLFPGGPGGFATTPAWHYESNLAGANLGKCVAPAGDVNGDGYADVIVGAPNASSGGLTHNGRAYLFLGGPGGLAGSPAWMLDGTEVSEELLGFSVATAGDVNDDGYDDVIIGEPGFNVLSQPDGSVRPVGILVTNQAGRVEVFLGGPSGLAATAAWFGSGLQPGDQFGYSVATANDVDGDRRSDIVVGAPDAEDVSNSGPTDAGSITLYLGGGQQGIQTPPISVIYGDNSGDHLGFSVAGAGDMDGDGHADVVAGSPGLSAAATFEGRVSLFRGSENGLQTIASFTDVGPVLNPALPGGQFGFSVAPAGDVNGDGLADFVAGAPYYTTNISTGIYVGYAAVYEGTRSGAVAVRTFTTSNGRGSEFGYSVCAAGDGDGDGLGDIVVGSPSRQTGDGYALVFRGGLDLPQGSVSWQNAASLSGIGGIAPFGFSVGDLNGDGFDDLALADRDPLHFGTPSALDVYLGGPGGFRTFPDMSFTANAIVPGASRVSAFLALGDVNGDGYADFSVSSDVGMWLVYGAPGGIYAQPATLPFNDLPRAANGDINGDGYGDVLMGNAFNRYDLFLGSPTGPGTAPATTLTAGGLNNPLGGLARFVGDVNGDGYGDVLVANGQYNDVFTSEGIAELFHGTSAGLDTTPVMTLQGAGTNEDLGSEIAALGDVNGDGFADFAVSSPGYQDGSLYGKFTIVLGGLTTTTQTFTASDAGLTSGELGPSVARAGDVNQDGYDDMLVFSNHVSTATASNVELAQLFLGSPAGIIGPAAWISSWPAGGGSSTIYLGDELDANGDGVPDVLLSVFTAADSMDFEVFDGNAGLTNASPTARAATLRQADDLAPMAPLDIDASTDSVRVAVRGGSAAGDTYVRAQSETAIWGSPFPPLSALTSGPWGPTYIAGPTGPWWPLDIGQGLVSDPSPLYKWRMRVQSRSPYFPWTPWLTTTALGHSQFSFRTQAQGDVLAGVVPGAPPGGLAMAEPRPNPGRGDVTLEFELPTRSNVSLMVYDIAGRRVRDVLEGSVESGTHSALWDGRDAAGHRVEGGIYFAHLTSGRDTRTEKLVRLP